jgi:hypothetical protein
LTRPLFEESVMAHDVQLVKARSWTYRELVEWFVGGLGVSALLIVVIPPLDLLLLVGLLIATVVRCALHRERNAYLVAMLIGVVPFSLYALVWALTVGG